MHDSIDKIFLTNIKMIDISDKALSAFRMQNFRKGLVLYREFIDIMMDILPLILSEQEYFCQASEEINENVISEMLGCMLDANESKDYVLLSDLLELRLLPFLVSIQEIILSIEGIAIPKNLFLGNIQGLSSTDKNLAEKLKTVGPISTEDSTDNLILEPTSCGLCTLAYIENNQKYYYHSNGQVMREARMIACEWYSTESYIYHVYGMGLGYHIIAMDEIDETIEIHVYESDFQVLRYAFTCIDLTQLLIEKRLYIHYDPDFKLLSTALSSSNEEDAFVIHYPSMRNIRNENMYIQLQEYFVSYSSVKNQIIQLNGNFRNNINAYNNSIDILREQFRDKKLIIVAAGPSLDNNYTHLKKIQKNTIVLATGTVFKKLLKEGIIPDYVIISDGTAGIYQQFSEVMHYKVPLLFLSTAYYKIPQNYQGSKYIICQEGYKKAEEYAHKKSFQIYQSGGSVSTIALDIGIRFHCKSIIFIGLDLAFTNNYDHASGTTTHIEYNKEGMQQVEDIYGKTVYTGKNLDMYRKWIEKRIDGVEEIEIIDATEGGAKIKGMKVMTLSDCINSN